MIQVVDILTNNLFVKLWDISLSNMSNNDQDKKLAKYNEDFSFIYILVL